MTICVHLVMYKIKVFFHESRNTTLRVVALSRKPEARVAAVF